MAKLWKMLWILWPCPPKAHYSKGSQGEWGQRQIKPTRHRPARLNRRGCSQTKAWPARQVRRGCNQTKPWPARQVRRGCSQTKLLPARWSRRGCSQTKLWSASLVRRVCIQTKPLPGKPVPNQTMLGRRRRSPPCSCWTAPPGSSCPPMGNSAV